MRKQKWSVSIAGVGWFWLSRGFWRSSIALASTKYYLKPAKLLAIFLSSLALARHCLVLNLDSATVRLPNLPRRSMPG